MSESEIKMPPVDTKQFADVVEMIRSTRRQVLRMANAALIDLYWQVGQYLAKKIASAEWGDGVVKQLAAHIEKNCPDIKGFSDKNLWRMKQFYEAYADENEKLSTVLREISWSNNNPSIGVLLCKDKDDEVVEYALSRSLSPTMVAEYQLCLPDKKLLQQKMREITE